MSEFHVLRANILVYHLRATNTIRSVNTVRGEDCWHLLFGHQTRRPARQSICSHYPSRVGCLHVAKSNMAQRWGPIS
jgi:hypothetical protein